MAESQNKLAAIKFAMDAEMQAHKYYSQSARKATNPKGKDMLNQLAAFELNHYNYLKSLFSSLEEGNGWIPYPGTQFSETAPASKQKGSSGEDMKDDVLSILSKAIEDEKNASAFYAKLAEETDDPSGKEMFKKLAEEEKLHTKILNDQQGSLRMGMRGRAKIYTGWQPLGRRLYRYLARTFHFEL